MPLQFAADALARQFVARGIDRHGVKSDRLNCCASMLPVTGEVSFSLKSCSGCFNSAFSVSVLTLKRSSRCPRSRARPAQQVDSCGTIQLGIQRKIVDREFIFGQGYTRHIQFHLELILGLACRSRRARIFRREFLRCQGVARWRRRLPDHRSTRSCRARCHLPAVRALAPGTGCFRSKVSVVLSCAVMSSFGLLDARARRS